MHRLTAVLVLCCRRVMSQQQAEETLLGMDMQSLLVLWFNYHLDRGGSYRKVHNFAQDLKVTWFNTPEYEQR